MLWLKDFSKSLPDAEISSCISEVSFDEMWHFLGKKKENSGFGERWIGFEIELLDGLSAIVLLRYSGNFSKYLSI